LGGTPHDLELYDVPAADPKAPVVIHPTAIVDKAAQLGAGVEIGPYCVVGPRVVLGDNVRLSSHVVVEGRTTVGARTAVHQFATLGVPPQDLKYKGEDSALEIGEENSIRQYVNMSLGSAGGGGKTVVGRRNLFMVYTHVGHDSIVGDNVVFANNATLGGHVVVDSHSVLGGCCAVHQFCRVGTRAMIGGGSMVVQDVPPFTMVQGDRAKPIGLNVVGLKRAGYSLDEVRDLKTMYRLLYNDGLTVEDCLARIAAEVPDSEARRTFTRFLRESERGVVR
jgi:UDP-N-acetylglucosamine acyltransferase